MRLACLQDVLDPDVGRLGELGRRRVPAGLGEQLLVELLDAQRQLL
jgi:hypothetical protein